MTTTALVVEILVIGLVACVWVSLVGISGAGRQLVELGARHAAPEWARAVLLALFFALAYTLGVMVNRAADWVLSRADASIRERFFPGRREGTASRWRRAQVLAMTYSGRLKARLDYGRMLLRISRSGMLNFLLIAVFIPIALARLGVLAELLPAAMTLCALSALAASLCYISWRRLAIADYDITRAALSLTRQMGDPRRGVALRFDASCAELESSVQAVVFCLTSNGPRFLVLRRTGERGGFWQSVTGGIMPGETPAEAAIREVREETGLVPVSIWPLEHSHEFHKRRILPTGAGLLMVSFEQSVGAQVSSGPVTLDPREHAEYRWLTLGEARDSVRFESNRDALQELHHVLDGCGLVPELAPAGAPGGDDRDTHGSETAR